MALLLNLHLMKLGLPGKHGNCTSCDGARNLTLEQGGLPAGTCTGSSSCRSAKRLPAGELKPGDACKYAENSCCPATTCLEGRRGCGHPAHRAPLLTAHATSHACMADLSTNGAASAAS